MNDNPIILAIESSCDDTSAAVYFDSKIRSNITSTQLIHKKYGGVLPEMASRLHQQHIIPVVQEALDEAGYKIFDIDAIAFTRGPGLLGSLLVGVSFAKAFALARSIPMMDVNHMQAHILAHFIENPKPAFPFLCLTVSGGHTQIVQVNDYLDMQVLGSTIDDAAGEAFDKTAKMLGLPYPGGPLLDQQARNGNPLAFKFAEPKVDGLNFSYSGLKTSVLYFLQKQTKTDKHFIQNNLADLCASVQYTIVKILIEKLLKAAGETGISEIAISGGVSANSRLRKEINRVGMQNGWNTFIPRLEYCTDNAAMIAMVGYYKYLNQDFCSQKISALARWPV